jgi:hypothetical protein
MRHADAPLPGFVSLYTTRLMMRNSTNDDGYMATDDFGFEKHLLRQLSVPCRVFTAKPKSYSYVAPFVPLDSDATILGWNAQ